MKTLIPILAMVILASSIIIPTEKDAVMAAEAEKDIEFTNVTITPEPGSELSGIDDPVTISFDQPIDLTTLGIAVVVNDEGLQGRVYFLDNNTIQYIPEWGYAYGRNVTFSIAGDRNGLTWENGSQALEGNVTFNLTMPYPDRYMIPLQYQGITEVQGHLTLFTEEGKSLQTIKSGSNGLFPLPDDFSGGFGVFNNGEDSVEVSIVRYGGPVFLAWDHVAFTDYPPFLMTGVWDSSTGNVTFSFSHLMDRESVEKNFRGDGLRGDFIWKGRDLTYRPRNLDDTKDYNVSIGSGAFSLWGEETQGDIWMEIYASEEVDRDIYYFVLFLFTVLVLIVLGGLFYAKAAYAGPRS